MNRYNSHQPRKHHQPLLKVLPLKVGMFIIILIIVIILIRLATTHCQGHMLPCKGSRCSSFGAKSAGIWDSWRGGDGSSCRQKIHRQHNAETYICEDRFQERVQLAEKRLNPGSIRQVLSGVVGIRTFDNRPSVRTTIWWLCAAVGWSCTTKSPSWAAIFLPGIQRTVRILKIRNRPWLLRRCSSWLLVAMPRAIWMISYNSKRPPNNSVSSWIATNVKSIFASQDRDQPNS